MNFSIRMSPTCNKLLLIGLSSEQFYIIAYHLWMPNYVSSYIPIVTDQTKPAHSFVYDRLIVNSSPNDQVKEKGGGEDIELSLVAGWSWWCVQRYLEWSLKDVSG